MRVHRRTRVAVLGARNRDLIDRILVPGEIYLVPNVRGLSLTASDAGAVELVLDGVSVGFAGKDGVRASGISLNLQSVLERRLSLRAVSAIRSDARSSRFVNNRRRTGAVRRLRSSIA